MEPALDPRYSRHLLLPQIGLAGQRRLVESSALVIGAGGLGSPVSLYLAAAGVGRVGIVDFDNVDVTNLHRQILHGDDDVGSSKTDSALRRLHETNPKVTVETHKTALTSSNAIDILSSYDVIVDGTDNFPTRYLVNDACVFLDKPNVYGSVFRFEGQASVFFASKGPCYRCLYPEPPPPGLVPSCAEGGVLGVLPGVVGLIQATEAIKLLLGAGDSLVGRLLLFDALKMQFRELRLRKDPACRVCGPEASIHELIDYEAFCGVKEIVLETKTVTPAELKTELDRGDQVILVDVREPYELDISKLEGAELMPLGTLNTELERLQRDANIVVYCRTGARSGRAVELLSQSGFSRVRNLVGGINRWAREVDPSMATY